MKKGNFVCWHDGHCGPSETGAPSSRGLLSSARTFSQGQDPRGFGIWYWDNRRRGGEKEASGRPLEADSLGTQRSFKRRVETGCT